MSSDQPPVRESPPAPSFPLLERVTAGFLIAVVFALGWIALVAYQPDRCRLPSVEAEVLLVIGLLVPALALVSLVALLHTRA